MANLGSVYITIKENMQPLVKGLKRAEAAVKKFTGITSRALRGISRSVFNLKSAFAVVFAGALAKNAIEIASGFDNMALSLETITKGKGVETFEELNKWALKMPVSTSKAIESYIQMRAMGLEPTIEQMTIMVDTASALGKGTEGVQRIARALGQMAAKGKVSAEELMQLAETGVPAMGILAEKFGNVETSTLNASTAIDALFEGMKKNYGGQSELMQNRWSGLVETIKGYWGEFVRLVMKSGVMEYLEDNLKTIVGFLDEAMEAGKLRAWAEGTGLLIVNWLDIIKSTVINTFDTWSAEIEVIKAELEGIIVVLKATIKIAEWAARVFNWVGKGIGEVLGSLVYGDYSRMLDEVTKPREIPWRPMVIMSPAQPWKSGIAEMKSDLASVGEQFEVAFDASRIASGITQISTAISGASGGVGGSRFGVTGTARVAGGENYVDRFWAANAGKRIGASGGLAKYLPYMSDEERFSVKMPGYQTGTRRVQNTGPAVIHKGEEITPEHRARRGRGLSIGNLTFNIGGGNAMQTARQIRLQLEQLAARGA